MYFLTCCPVSECPGRQALSSTATSSTLPTMDSQLSPAPNPSTRPARSLGVSSSSTSNEVGTSIISPTAFGFTSEASSRDISTTISYSHVAATVPSPTVLGTSSHFSSSLTSLSISSAFVLPPEGSPSLSSAMTGSPSQSPISVTGQPTELPPSSSSAQIGSSSQLSFFLTSQPTSDSVRPSSTTFDTSQTLSAIFEPFSTQSVILTQDSASFSSSLASFPPSILSPTPYSTSPDTISSTTSGEGPSSLEQAPSLTLTLISSRTSYDTSDISSTGATSSAPSNLESLKSGTTTSSRASATNVESAPSSSAPTISTRSPSEASRSETSTPNTASPSSASSEGPTSLTDSTGSLLSASSRSIMGGDSSTTSSDITSSITSSKSYTTIYSSTSSSLSSSSSPSSTPEAYYPVCPPGPENKLSFGFTTYTAGSIGYTGRTQGDFILFYATSPPGDDGLRDGYLYHSFSGLCVTATAPTSSMAPKYTGAGVQLQPCGPLSQTPPEAQLFSGTRDPSLNNVGIVFRGDLATYQWYGSAVDSSSNAPVSLVDLANGNYWYYDCFR